jgi:sugar/nucleoside kinase (ribokinase family)
MGKVFDVIAIGDSTIDLFMEVDFSETEIACFLDKRKCVICFDWGTKIPTKSLTRVPGVGNAANLAVGMVRLGLTTAIYTVIGSDEASYEIKKVLEDEGVDTSFVVMESGKRSNLSVVLNYGVERNIFVYHEQRSYNLPPLPASKWVYYTSVGKDHQNLNHQVVEYVKKYGAKLGFNPGSHQLRTGIKGLSSVLEVTEVLLVNREEAVKLVGGDPQDTKSLIKRLKETGVGTVVITDGPAGSYASFDGREVWFADIPKTNVVERTGAGDAYSTGFLAALGCGCDLPEAMIWGTVNATSVIQHIGAREGLLTREKMEEFVAKYIKEIKPRMV